MTKEIKAWQSLNGRIHRTEVESLEMDLHDKIIDQIENTAIAREVANMLISDPAWFGQFIHQYIHAYTREANGNCGGAA